MTDTPSRAAAGTAPSILMLALVSGLGPLSLNIVVPSVPSIAAAFSTGYATAQLVVTVFIIAMALGQLVIGTLSDALGRRPILLAGMMIYVIGSAMCALAPTVEVLIASRFIEAVGGVSGVVLARAIIRDVYHRDQAASALGYVTMVMVVAPMLAPAAGGVLDDLVGWRAGFAVLTAVGLGFLMLAHARIAETNLNARQRPRFGALTGSFVTLLAIPAFLAFTGAMSFASATFFTFLGAAPHVVIELMGNTPTEYGLAFVSISIAFMTGNFTAARLSSRLGTMPLIIAGSILCLVGALVMSGFVYFGELTTATLFGSMMIITFSNGTLMPAAIASAVSVRPDLAGAASGLSGSIQFSVAASATYVVALLADGTAWPMIWMLVLFAVASLIAAMAAWRLSPA
jgi:DHA1 family bicyclomycin/chloramphenicol resistance-like MFS transporter